MEKDYGQSVLRSWSVNSKFRRSGAVRVHCMVVFAVYICRRMMGIHGTSH